ncbi:MAG TPA: ABC transporter permease [Clostridia bacterium]|nr:ABC transporter permease [Clostridia bacterium]
MDGKSKMPAEMWEPIERNEIKNEDKDLKSRGFWSDAWCSFKRGRFAMTGLLFAMAVVFTAVLGPVFFEGSMSDQNLKLTNIPPILEISSVGGDSFVYVHREYKLIEVTENGEISGRLYPIEDNLKERFRTYSINGSDVKLDYSPAAEGQGQKYKLTVGDREVFPIRKVLNKTYLFGTDNLGRDLFIRVVYGARISLSIAFAASLVNLFIGVFYGGISGLAGGRTDDLMMRFVDMASAIPMILYVILLTVVIGNGIRSIILAMGMVYWVHMARIVRGQVLSLKKKDYVASARISGAGWVRIMTKHLIPNTTGPIIVAMAAMIPGAIFTEAFLSFIGLGVPAPEASWGTLANDALDGIGLYGYQLFFPAAAICLTMMAFNFISDGARDAMDPRTGR